MGRFTRADMYVYRDESNEENETHVVLYAQVDYAPASFRGHPDNWHGDESEMSEMEAVLEDGTPIELTKEEKREAVRRLFEAAKEEDVYDPY